MIFGIFDPGVFYANVFGIICILGIFFMLVALVGAIKLLIDDFMYY
jgi:hypothetical protein